MDKVYYRHVAGANPPDPALMGPELTWKEISKINGWLLRMRRKPHRYGLRTDMREMQRVAKVKRKWGKKNVQR